MKRIKQPVSSYPSLLAAARRKAGWNQAELARRLGVGQQAVSKWERGVVVTDESTKARIAAALPEGAATDLHGVEARALTPPSTSEERNAALVARLNLGHLTGEQFQSFAADLLQAMHPSATVNVYGVSGDVQDGIDIELRFPEGFRYTAQCKRVKNFGPERVRQAVREHRGPAKKKLLLVTRPATVQARDAAAKFATQGWELWDIDDISRRVRYLPSDKARALVDAYAPGQRKDFLGIDQPSPFLAPSAFFKEFLRPEAVFSHIWGIVGRSAELVELRRAVDEGAVCITVVGAGGTGKSRLALEFLNQMAAAPGLTLRVLAPAATPTAADVEQYRGQRGLFLVEDAHDRDDLAGIVSHFRQHVPEAVLLLTTRPYAVERLNAMLARCGIDDRSRCVRLQELKRGDLERLAQEILKARGFATDIAEDIARLADHSPLFTVIASNLVAEKRLHPSVLSNEARFKERVLAHFSDVLTHALVEDIGEQAKARDLLNLMAVLQPVEIAGSAFAAALEGLYSRAATEYDHVRQLLVDASVLIVRGGRARIAPDMLADYILEKACAAPPTKGTTFPERVLAALQPGQLRNVLHNLAKLDWRLTVQEGLAPRASAQIWRAIEQMYEKQSGAREAILEAVEHAAYYLPAQAFAFLDRIEVAPSGGVDRVSRILRNAGYHTAHVREAAERLWELGKNRPGQLNSTIDHPIRQLQSLASIEPGKPLKHIEEVLELGLELLGRPDAGAHIWSPFEFLQHILATEGHTHTAKGNAVQIGHFTVNVKTLATLRKQLLEAALRLAEQTDLRIALRALQMIGNAALRYPIRGGHDVRAELEAEFVETLKTLEMLVRRNRLDPLAVLEVVRAVSWHVGYNEGPVREAAKAVLAAVPSTFEQRLTDCLVEGFGHHRERRRDDPTRAIERWREDQRDLGRELRRTFQAPEKALDALRERLAKFASAGPAFHGQPHIFIRLVCEDWPEFAEAVARSSLADASDPIAEYAEQGLGALLWAGSPQAETIVEALLEKADVLSRRRVAVAYGHSSRAGARMRPEDLAMIHRLCADEDEFTVSQVIAVLYRLSGDAPELAKQLIFKARIGASEKVADELASHLCNSEALRVSLSAEEAKEFLARLEALEEIEGHWVQEFLGLLSASHPGAVVDFLLARVERAERDSRGYEYRAVPFHWTQRSQLRRRDTGYFRTALERVLECARNAHISKSRERHAVNELFAIVAGHFDDSVRDFLADYLATADTHGVAAVSQVISEISGDVLFTHLDFAEALLRAAGRFGTKRKEEAEFALYRATTRGMRSGTRGQPFPQDVALKANAEEALRRTRTGSPARQVLTWIIDHARGQIERAHLEGELIEED